MTEIRELEIYEIEQVSAGIVPILIALGKGIVLGVSIAATVDVVGDALDLWD